MSQETAPQSPQPGPRKLRGGRRPGAGAPKGNTNAVRHGLHSRRVREIARVLQSMPAFRSYQRRIARRTGSTQAARDLALLGLLLIVHHLERGAAEPVSHTLTKRQLRRLALLLAGETINRNAPRQIREQHPRPKTIKQSNRPPDA